MFNKKPKIEFFNEYDELLKTPPVKASRALPEWFKKMRPSHEIPPSSKFPFGISDKLPLSNVNATVKRCPGLISYMTEGYIIPLWSDVVVQVREQGLYAFGANESATPSMHSRKMQFDAMPEVDGYYKDALKITNPWKVRTPKGWSVMILPPFYHFEDRFQVLPGVVDSDSYHHIHVNMLFTDKVGDYQLNQGMPFVQIVPFKRDSLELDVRKSTDADKKVISDLRFRMNRFFSKVQSIKNG